MLPGRRRLTHRALLDAKLNRVICSQAVVDGDIKIEHLDAGADQKQPCRSKPSVCHFAKDRPTYRASTLGEYVGTAQEQSVPAWSDIEALAHTPTPPGHV